MRELIVTGDEIPTKGRNRRYFEKVLTRNVWNALGRRAALVPRRLFGRISVPVPDEMEEAAIAEAVARVPGVARFSLARRCESDVEAMKALAVAEAGAHSVTSFGVRVQRSNKGFPMTSREVEFEVGGAVKAATDWDVDLKAPELWIHLQITENGTYLTAARYRGMGGLPVRSSGKVVALLSGGLDSPVAAYRMFRRGCAVSFVHFLNQGQGTGAVRDKVRDLVAALTKFQQRSALFIVPFEDIQRELVAMVPSPFRMLAYRRTMLRIAGLIAEREGAKALVTGDCVGQVASQTMSNLQTIWDAAPLPVFAPLIATNKQETVDVATEIGTYEISSEPGEDCCQFLIDEHPATRSTPAELAEYEARIPGLAELEAAAAREVTPEIMLFPPQTGEKYPAPRRYFHRRGRRR